MEALHHRLLQEHDFAVMDPCVVEKSHWPDLPATSLAPRQLASRSHLLPFLLDLRNLPPERVGALLDACARWEAVNSTPYLSGLISMACDTPQAAETLSPRFIVRKPRTSNAALLRWHDPRVFEHLLGAFDRARIHQLLRSVLKWTWRNRRGAWVTTRPEDKTPVSRGMDEATWLQLGRIATLNRILDEVCTPADDVGFADQVDKALTLLNRAYDVHGLTHEADCRLFVRHALQYGPSIHAHPQLKSCVAQAAAGHSTYVGACSRLPADWLSAWTEPDTHPRTEENGV